MSIQTIHVSLSMHKQVVYLTSKVLNSKFTFPPKAILHGKSVVSVFYYAQSHNYSAVYI